MSPMLTSSSEDHFNYLVRKANREGKAPHRFLHPGDTSRRDVPDADPRLLAAPIRDPRLRSAFIRAYLAWLKR
jgi:hypothetical protein